MLIALMWLGISAADQAQWIALERRATECQLKGDLECARTAAEAALKLAERDGSDDGWVAVSLSNAGSIYQDFGDRPRAERYYRRAIAIQKRIENKLGLARTTSNLASLYLEDGHVRKAERLNLESLRPALAGWREEIDRLDRNLAAIHRYRGRDAEAEAILRRQLAEVRSPQDRLVILNNLAVVHFDRKRYAEALPYFEEAVAIAEQAGPANPALPRCLHNLAVCRLRMNRVPEALALMERAVTLPVADDLRRAELLATYADLLKRSQRKRESAAAEHEAKALRQSYVRRNSGTVNLEDLK